MPKHWHQQLVAKLAGDDIAIVLIELLSKNGSQFSPNVLFNCLMHS
jgi:hypothetical protein